MPASAPPFVITKLVGEDIAAKSLSLSGGTITANAPVIDNTITWNNAAVAFTGIKLNVTDTASLNTSLLIDVQRNGVSQFAVNRGGALVANTLQSQGTVFVNNSSPLSWSGSDLMLYRDAANTLAQRNGTNAQTIRIYNTYTDGSNYERSFAQWSSNIFHIGTEAGGTGSARDMRLGPNASGGWLHFRTSNSDRWSINGSGHLIAVADNTYDIGASGANRPRAIYVATSGSFGGAVSAGNTSGFATGRMLLNTPDSNGVVKIGNAGGTDFDRLQFGGTTSSFPALKRSTTILQARLADDSAFAPIQGIHRTHTNAVAETPTATHTIEIQDASGTTYKVLAVAA